MTALKLSKPFHSSGGGIVKGKKIPSTYAVLIRYGPGRDIALAWGDSPEQATQRAEIILRALTGAGDG